ncbi:MAG: alpha/beta hydrolase-fold protein [Candidatus Sericytochromatia bacterium]
MKKLSLSILSLTLISLLACNNSQINNNLEEQKIDSEQTSILSKYSKDQKDTNKQRNSFKNFLAKNYITGIVEKKNVKSKFLKSGNRDLVVYLPPSYYQNTSKKYPVLYMHDGQNIFDASTAPFGEWYVDEKVQYLIQKNIIDEIIVVGIYNGESERLNELTWNPMTGEGGGNGKKYGEFLTKEAKPFIDKTYRTKSDRDNTAVAGSSLGGLISFYLALNYQDTFSKVGIMSPSFWWNDGEAIKEVSKFNKNFDFWLDCGSNEGSDGSVMVGYVNGMYNALTNKFGKDKVLKYIQQGAGHNESAWAERIHSPIIDFFGKEKNFDNKTKLINRLMSYDEWAKL